MAFKQTMVVSLAGGVMCAVGVMGFVAGHASSPSTVELVAQPEGFEPTPDMIKEMIEEASKLAPEHKQLVPMVGEWDAEMSFQMAPGAEPDVSRGTCTNKLILGGRLMTTEFKGEAKMFGQTFAFSGFGLMGFSKETGAFQSTWCDSMSTSIIVSSGKPTEDPKEIVVSGSMPSEQGDVPAKWVYKIESDKKHVMEMWQGMPGAEEMMQIGTITYTKKEK